MFPYLVLVGLLLLVGLVMVIRWYASADTQSVLRFFKWLAYVILGFLLIFFVFSGRLGWTFMALPALIPIFLRLRTALRTYKNFSKMMGLGGTQASNQTSDVETKTLKMSLNQDTGEMTGIILDGPNTGKKIEEMGREEIFQVVGYCLQNDHEAAQILEAYLDRSDPDWRSSFYSNEQAPDSKVKGMERKEALQVLGLGDEATDLQIKKAYHNLISNLHPDKGGSAYLAAKINQAKETLLGK